MFVLNCIESPYIEVLVEAQRGNIKYIVHSIDFFIIPFIPHFEERLRAEVYFTDTR